MKKATIKSIVTWGITGILVLLFIWFGKSHIRPVNIAIFTQYSGFPINTIFTLDDALYIVYLCLLPVLAAIRFYTYRKPKLWVYLASWGYQITLALVVQFAAWTIGNYYLADSVLIPKFIVIFSAFPLIPWLGIPLLVFGNFRTLIHLINKKASVESTVLDDWP